MAPRSVNHTGSTIPAFKMLIAFAVCPRFTARSATSLLMLPAFSKSKPARPLTIRSFFRRTRPRRKTAEPCFQVATSTVRPLPTRFDYAALAVTDLCGITERRVDRLLNPDINEGLPAFLSSDPGLSSGFMIAQIVSAALINECQVLAHPSSTGSIPTDGGKEDHVSMGMTGALKLRQIVEHAERILAIELMCAAQGLEFRLPLRSSHAIERAYAAVRSVVPRLEKDRVLAPDIDALAAAIRAGRLDEWCA